VGGRVFQRKPRAAPVPADTWRLRTSPRQDAGSLRTGGSGWYAGVRDPVGGPRPPTVNVERSLLDTWRHRTLPRAGNGSGTVGRVRWALDRGGPAVQPVSAQLRITTRVLPRHSKRGYPGPGVPTCLFKKISIGCYETLMLLGRWFELCFRFACPGKQKLDALRTNFYGPLNISSLSKKFNKESVGRKIIALTHT